MVDIIRLRQDAVHNWQFVGDGEELPDNGYAVVTLGRLPEALAVNSLAGVGVRLEPSDDVATLTGSLARLAMIELAFPTFRDGRAYSSARILRAELGYTGELRAVGDVLVDQLHFMVRVGIDAVVLPAGVSRVHAETALQRWRDVYQVSSDDRVPVWESRSQRA
jgi:uncharacterized protein (DUF934 family)